MADAKAKLEARPTGFWLRMDDDQNEEKRAGFARDFVIGTGFDQWAIDGLFMLCEAFVDADRHKTNHAEDLAGKFQKELFVHTIEFDDCLDAYRNFVRTGTRDYEASLDDQMHARALRAIAASLLKRAGHLDPETENLKDGNDGSYIVAESGAYDVESISIYKVGCENCDASSGEFQSSESAEQAAFALGFVAYSDSDMGRINFCAQCAKTLPSDTAPTRATEASNADR